MSVTTFRRRVSVSQVALVGDNATLAAQQALEKQVAAALARFAKHLGFTEGVDFFAIRKRSVEALIETHFVLDPRSLDYEKKLADFLASEVDPTWTVFQMHTLLPGTQVASKSVHVTTLAIAVPAKLPRQPLTTYAFSMLARLVGLSLVAYILFIVLGS